MPPHSMTAPNRDFVHDCTHFFTITLKPELYSNQIRQQHRKTYKCLTTFMQSHCDKYLLVAELTKDCNLHYHAVLKLSALVYEGTDLSDMNFLNNLKTLKPFGFKKLEIVRNLNESFNYITKELKKTHGTLNPSSKTCLDVWNYWVKQPIPTPQTTLAPIKDDYKEEEDHEHDNTMKLLNEFDDWDYPNVQPFNLGVVTTKKKNNKKPKPYNDNFMDLNI